MKYKKNFLYFPKYEFMYIKNEYVKVKKEKDKINLFFS